MTNEAPAEMCCCSACKTAYIRRPGCRREDTGVRKNSATSCSCSSNAAKQAAQALPLRDSGRCAPGRLAM